jgi:hypothetical protein
MAHYEFRGGRRMQLSLCFYSQEEAVVLGSLRKCVIPKRQSEANWQTITNVIRNLPVSQ